MVTNAVRRPDAAAVGPILRVWAILVVSAFSLRLASIGEFVGLGSASQTKYVIWSLVVAPAMAYAWGVAYLLHPRKLVSVNPHARRILGFTMALIPLAIIYGLVGYYAGNPTRYLAGDTFKYLLTPFGFYIAAVGVTTISRARWLLRGMAVFGYYPGLDIGGHLMPLSYVYGRKAAYWRRYSWLLVLPLVYISIKLNRTSLMVVPVITVMLYWYGGRLAIRRVLMVTGVVTGIVLATLQIRPELVTGTGAWHKFTLMRQNFTLVDYRFLDMSTYQRVQEAVLVARKFGDASLPDQLFGFGSGAVFPVTDLPESQQTLYEDAYGGSAHHIHISPIFVYHQWGIPGILLLTFTAVTLLRAAFWLAKQRPRGSDPVSRERYSLQVAAFIMIAAFFGYGGWNPPKISLFYFGILLGTFWRLMGSDVLKWAPVPRSVPRTATGGPVGGELVPVLRSKSSSDV